MADLYGMNLRGDIEERNPDDPTETCRLFWRAGSTVCASDGGMNLLLRLLNDWPYRQPQPEPNLRPCSCSCEESIALRKTLDLACLRLAAVQGVVERECGRIPGDVVSQMVRAMMIEGP